MVRKIKVFSSLNFNSISYKFHRWVKFEEVVENTKEHWSKPHVGILSLRSIFDLKEMIANAVLSLNLAADNLEDILGKMRVK